MNPHDAPSHFHALLQERSRGSATLMALLESGAPVDAGELKRLLVSRISLARAFDMASTSGRFPSAPELAALLLNEAASYAHTPESLDRFRLHCLVAVENRRPQPRPAGSLTTAPSAPPV